MRNGIVISESPPSPRPPKRDRDTGGYRKTKVGGEGVRGKRKGKEEYEAEGRSGVERW